MAGYTARNWYWIVGESQAQVYSSSRGKFVPNNDQDYQAFRASGRLPSRIASTGELYDVLKAQAPIQAAAMAAEMFDALTPQQALAVRLSIGLKVESKTKPELNGVYPVDDGSRSKLSALSAGIAAGKKLPSDDIGVVDVSGTVHHCSSNEIAELASAIEAYVFDLYTTEALLLAGGSSVWPADEVTIP